MRNWACERRKVSVLKVGEENVGRERGCGKGRVERSLSSSSESEERGE